MGTSLETYPDHSLPGNDNIYGEKNPCDLFYTRSGCNRWGTCKLLHQQGSVDFPEKPKTYTMSSEKEDRELTPIRKVTLKTKSSKRPNPKNSSY